MRKIMKEGDLVVAEVTFVSKIDPFSESGQIL